MAVARRTCLGWVLLAAWSGAASAQIRVEGTQILVEDSAGTVQSGIALEGAELDLGNLGTLRILRASRDAEARFPNETWLFDTQLRAPGRAEFVNVCAEKPNQDARMMIFSGYLDPNIRYVADPNRFSLSCTSGVEAKCLRWGYLPWRRSPIGAVSLAPYFETCVRLARADYCGDGQATTRDGTAIDAYDEVGIMQRTPNLPDFAFEAGWGPQGAVCAHHARIPENLALADLPSRCPRLAAAEIGAGCTEDHARAQGALIVTRSVIRAAASAASTSGRSTDQ